MAEGPAPRAGPPRPSIAALVQFHVEAERAELLHQHVEALGDARLERVGAAHDLLVGVEEGLALCTALVPVIGYDQAAKLAKIAHGEGRTIRAVALDHTSLTADDLARLLDPFTMIHPEAVVADTVATAETADKGETPAETPKSPGSDVLSFTQFKVLGKPRSSGRAYLLAITGGISTGKGVVGSAFEDFGVPVFEIRAAGGNETDMLIRDKPLAAALAKSLGQGTAVLMRGHGDVVVGNSVKTAVLHAIYTDLNAKLQADALRLGGKVTYLNEVEARKIGDTNDSLVDRPWNLWKIHAEARGAEP